MKRTKPPHAHRGGKLSFSDPLPVVASPFKDKDSVNSVCPCTLPCSRTGPLQVLVRRGHPRIKLWLFMVMFVGVSVVLAAKGTLALRRVIQKNFQTRHAVFHSPTAATMSANHGAGSYRAYQKCINDPTCQRFPKIFNNSTQLLPHDYPGHVWHWTRADEPDVEIGQKRDCKGSLYLDMYNQFHKEGFVIFESCSLKHNPALLEAVRDLTASMEEKNLGRIQDAPNQSIKDIAIDPDTLEFMSYIHGGRQPFPFQTLNFKYGTEQPMHSDLVHFDTSPRSLMSATWVALEDSTPDNGPLQYVPGSHLYGTWDYDEISLREKALELYPGMSFWGQEPYGQELQELYGQELLRLTAKAGLELKKADNVKKGQTVIWAAGLVHGGSGRKDRKLTRLSQVTHYFFEGADFAWSPRLSELEKGQTEFLWHVTPRCTAPDYAPQQIHSCADFHIERWKTKCPEGVQHVRPKNCWW